jgi:hypothetical protein
VISAFALPATAQHRPNHHPVAAPAGATTTTAPAVAISATPPDGGASFSLRLDRGHGAEYPRTDYSRATVRVVPTLDRNRPAFQLYGRARFYTLDGEYHDLTCTLVVYADGTTLAARDYPCRDRSPTIDLANVDGMHVVTLTDSRVEFRIATATMITSQHVYRDIVFRLEARDGMLLTPPRDYRP